MTIGERIRKRRIELGLTQDQLAQRVGYSSRVSINKIESGERELTQSKIKAIADALNTTPSYIMGWLDETMHIRSLEQDNTYYVDEETRKTAQAIKDNKELSLLFDAAKDAKPEDLKQVHDLLLFLKSQERKD